LRSLEGKFVEMCRGIVFPRGTFLLAMAITAGLFLALDNHPRGCAGQKGMALAMAPGNMPPGTPRLYGYDHSHYTVRCRMALGLKQMPYRMVWVAEDDAETPTELVGKKITPIIAFPGEEPMAESGDIINRVDNDAAYGPPVLKQKTERPEVDTWLKRLSVPMRNLGRPRYTRSSMLPEFRSRSARDRFMTTHPLPDPETGVALSKAEWGQLPQEEHIRIYDHYWANSEAQLAELNEALQGVKGLIVSEGHVSSHGVSWDDIIFFSRLRGLTLIRGINLPGALADYLAAMSERTDVPLLTQMAL